MSDKIKSFRDFYFYFFFFGGLLYASMIKHIGCLGTGVRTHVVNDEEYNHERPRGDR